MGLGLLLSLLLFWTWGTQGTKLDPNGQHVCVASRPSAEPQCCPGWRQKDQECTIPICEGPEACQKDEVCVKPGLCRCKPGFFGAQCSSRCPSQYWGPDCRESCPCHPHGQCEPDTGTCHCQPDRWGDRCEFECTCTHGHCDPQTGTCRCDPGWWAPTCHRPCQCNLAAARCDATTGACLCEPGWWGRRCSFRCACHGSPCVQESGRCACRPDRWGPACRERCSCVRGRCGDATGHCACPPGYHGERCELPCPAGRYGAQCQNSCGHCKQNKPCAPDTGSCESCEPGWNGTRCHRPCPPGTFGEGCKQLCPRCHLGESCQSDTGHCQHCDPGWQGSRCEEPCPRGTFGKDCSSTCPTCNHGTCDAVTGDCVCSAGYWGPSCNTSCPIGFHGENCSVPCQCPEGPCHPVSGSCQLGLHSQDATLIAGILVPLLLLLLGIACCGCCCWAARLDPKDRPTRDGAAVSRVKLQVWGALTSLGSLLPCGSLSSHKLPWVTVLHHDPEIPFNHSFIEPPSAGWVSEDSFSSDPESQEEDEGPAYCVPPQEGLASVVQVQSPEASLAADSFPPPEDASTPFAIPRTSSLARAKRPSVSFAEGTKFAPQSHRGSGELSSPLRKPKRLSQAAQLGPEGQEAEESTALEPTETDENPRGTASPRDSVVGNRQFPLGSWTVAERVEAIEGNMQERSGPVTTIYMLAGAPRPSEGLARSTLHRFANSQKGQAEPKVKSAIPKPPRRALSRNKGSARRASGSTAQSSDSTPYEEVEGAGPGEAAKGLGGGTESPGRAQELVPEGGLPEKDPQKPAEEKVQTEPPYENVAPISGPSGPRGP
ncbi:PREDICTED: scavenger receptor class F member 1 [Elephantulus edwardii]|uniref:scavenger receptor class F member 1 n=1 Tax=Elephantulus edwardii TaxID=28737 RepID=UPI0003F0995C|nr:PREDICTED: scavenger receptor class F member 1 [Elephantulus edwardii]